MNTFWLKIAGIVVGVFVAVILIATLVSKNNAQPTQQSDSADKPKTVYDTWERDDEKFSVKPQQQQPTRPSPQPQPTSPAQTTQQPAQTTPQPKFQKLTFEEDVQAQRIFEMAKTERKRGRLPMMGYKMMVDYCREIIRKWPQSEYAFQCKRMLADIPPRYHKIYKITEKEMDLSNFY